MAVQPTRGLAAIAYRRLARRPVRRSIRPSPSSPATTAA